jgi:asparagine synthase (glutamine-hydrolysing)
MSAIFGVWNPRGPIVERTALTRLAKATTKYGPDATKIGTFGHVGMGYQAFQTHLRSVNDEQPYCDTQGNLVVFDGRLDNYSELRELHCSESEHLSDSALVLAAFQKSGEECFLQFVGEWALALWSAVDRTLYLARDHAGTRALYYSEVNGTVKWSTYLETFFSGDILPEINIEYAARQLMRRSTVGLSPYKSIHEVPPAHFARLRQVGVTTRQYWPAPPGHELRYLNTTEYDEQFLHLFRRSIQRRIHPVDTVLAELSGGMDSSSIVCMADKVTDPSNLKTSLVDTLSYYDDLEPDWNERPYFQAIERHRGKSGTHIEQGSQLRSYEPLILRDRFYPYPGAEQSSLAVGNTLQSRVGAGRIRCVLSGIGGDELLGGVPNPVTELADYLWRGEIRAAMSSAYRWSLTIRQPIVRVLFDAFAYTSRVYGLRRPEDDVTPPWLRGNAFINPADASRKQEGVFTRLRTRPSYYANAEAWLEIVENLPSHSPNIVGCFEYRFPYLDRQLVDFLHRVPRSQLVAPGRRRLLMRRALKGVVPEDVLERRRKAYIVRGPITSLRNCEATIEKLFQTPLMADYGLIDTPEFLAAFRRELAGEVRWIGQLKMTIRTELWLRSYSEWRSRPRSESSIDQETNEDQPGDQGRARSAQEVPLRGF